MRTVAVPDCPFCGQTGKVLHQGLTDRNYHAEGLWNIRQCPSLDCGLVWLDPMPIQEDIYKAYQTYYTQDQPEPTPAGVRKAVYDIWRSYLGHRFGYKTGVGPGWVQPFWWLALMHPGGRDELDALAMYLSAPPPGARVLEVGCGSGKVLLQMKAMGWQTEGVELDPKAVAVGRKKGLEIKQGQLIDQKYPDNSFDAIHMSHVIEHIRDPWNLLQECFRILKPGGRLVAMTPNTASLGHRQYGAAWLNLDPPRHLILFNKKNLRSAVEKQGFRVERLESSVRTAWVYGALSHQIQKHGRAEMSELHKAGALFHGLVFQYKSRLARRGNADAGDELVLVARKP